MRRSNGLGAVRRAQRSQRRSSAGRRVCEGRREAACRAGCGEASSPASRPVGRRRAAPGSIREPTAGRLGYSGRSLRALSRRLLLGRGAAVAPRTPMLLGRAQARAKGRRGRRSRERQRPTWQTPLRLARSDQAALRSSSSAMSRSRPGGATRGGALTAWRPVGRWMLRQRIHPVPSMLSQPISAA